MSAQCSSLLGSLHEVADTKVDTTRTAGNTSRLAVREVMRALYVLTERER
jgi:hypothetical protein